MKRNQTDHPPGRSTFKKPGLIRFKNLWYQVFYFFVVHIVYSQASRVTMNKLIITYIQLYRTPMIKAYQNY